MAKKQMDVSADKRVRRKTRAPDGERSTTTESAEQEVFQHWVNDQLRKLYDPVLDEPIPEQMLELLRQHRRSR